MAIRDELERALATVEVRACLRMIRQGESSQTDDAYRMMYGRKFWTGSLARHPRIEHPTPWGSSDAFGAYQILSDDLSTPKVEVNTYDRLAAVLGPSMEPHEQDLKAVLLIKWRGVLGDVLAGRIAEAIGAPKPRGLCWEWASLPGNDYGQPIRTIEQCLSTYREWVARLAPPVEEVASAPSPPEGLDFDPDSLDTEHYEGPEPYAYTPKGAAMSLPVLTTLGLLIPQINKVLNNPNVAERNVEAASAIINTVVAASGKPTVGEAVAAMRTDPGLTKAVTEAVITAPELIGLVEVGGGIAAAREAARVDLASPGPWWKFIVTPHFWVTVLLVPLLYIATVPVMFGLGGGWSDNHKTLVITALLSGLLGALSGFFYGSSLGSQAKDQRARAADTQPR